MQNDNENEYVYEPCCGHCGLKNEKAHQTGIAVINSLKLRQFVCENCIEDLLDENIIDEACFWEYRRKIYMYKLGKLSKKKLYDVLDEYNSIMNDADFIVQREYKDMTKKWMIEKVCEEEILFDFCNYLYDRFIL